MSEEDKSDFFDPERNIREQRTFLHDLSNPLSISLGMLEIAFEKAKKQGGIEPKVLSCMEKSLNALHRMVDQLKKRREILIAATPENYGKDPSPSGNTTT